MIRHTESTVLCTSLRPGLGEAFLQSWETGKDQLLLKNRHINILSLETKGIGFAWISIISTQICQLNHYVVMVWCLYALWSSLPAPAPELDPFFSLTFFCLNFYLIHNLLLCWPLFWKSTLSPKKISLVWLLHRKWKGIQCGASSLFHLLLPALAPLPWSLQLTKFHMNPLAAWNFMQQTQFADSLPYSMLPSWRFLWPKSCLRSLVFEWVN